MSAKIMNTDAKNNNPAHCDCKEIQNNYTMIQNNYKELQEEMTARDASV